MTRRSTVSRSVLIAGIAGAIFACSDPESRVPTSPTAPGPDALEIIGPSSVGPTSTAKFNAGMRLGDGTLKAIAGVRWFSSNPAMLLTDANGFVSGQGRTGEAILVAEVVGLPGGVRRSSREVVLTPDGTFRLTGAVSDADFPNLRLADARVEAAPGVFANTDSRGEFRLYGVPPRATVQVTKDGYSPLAQDLDLTGHLIRSFRLSPDEARLSLAGNYTLTVTAGGACPGFPAELRNRSYDAVITQTGLALTVTMPEARFKRNSIGRGNQFTGTAGIRSATFSLESFTYAYYYAYAGPTSYPSLLEQLTDGTHLEVMGQATTSGSATALSGTINGLLRRWDKRFPGTIFSMGSCSGAHQFSLTRR